jgi:hypothetical protein
MKTLYRVFGFLIAALVFVQAAAVAYGFFGLGKWVEGGGVVDKAAMESDTTTFPGLNGLVIHGLFGTMVIPIVALLFLIVSFFAKIPGGIVWALIVVGTVIVQVALGLFAHEIPALGILHGMVALALLGLALTAAQRVPKALAGRTSEPAAMATSAPSAGPAV